jgi:C_GCAxxG_C_C family probable redox protein
MTVEDRAVEYFTKGYSCAQAVLAACATDIGLNEAQALRLGSAMGAGLCGLRETCGAVLAMVQVWGARFAPTTPMDAKTKAALYAQAQALVRSFESAYGTHQCKALLKQASIEKQAGIAPEERTAAYYAKRPCARFVAFCARTAMMEQAEIAVLLPAN